MNDGVGVIHIFFNQLLCVGVLENFAQLVNDIAQTLIKIRSGDMIKKVL